MASTALDALAVPPAQYCCARSQHSTELFLIYSGIYKTKFSLDFKGKKAILWLKPKCYTFFKVFSQI